MSSMISHPHHMQQTTATGFWKAGLLVSLFFFQLAANAQEKMETDRPDQTDGTSIVPLHHLQLESEVYLNTFKKHRPAIISSSILRYGISNRLEVRAIAEQGKNRNTFIDETVQGIYPLSAGLKMLILDEHPIFPALALVTQVQVPVSNPRGARGSWSPSFIISLEKSIGDFNLCSNAGIKQNPFDADWCWPVSLDVKYEAGKDLEVFTEYFAQYTPLLRPDHNADAGLLFHVSKHFIIYGALGARLFTHEHNYFVNSGVGLLL